MKKKIVAILLGVSIVSTMLVGCTKDVEDTTGKQNAETSNDQTSDEKKGGLKSKVSKYYNADGSLGGYDEYEYDRNGIVIRRKSYNADGSLNGYGEAEYDKNGNCIGGKYYNADGSVVSYGESEYDENGNWISEKDYNADGSLSSEEINTYYE